MTLKDTCLGMIFMHPQITPNIVSAYDHLFCVNGNGYYWKNGELIYDWEEGKYPDDIYEYIDCDIIDRMNDKVPRDWGNENCKIKFKFYPLSKYSKMCQIPDNIKTDWLKGIKEMVEIMEKYPEYLDRKEEDLIWLERVKERINEIENGSIH